MKRIRVIIIGAGNRGNRYATHMAEMPDKYQIVGMADPAKACRKHFQEVYGVPEEACYESWEEILAQPKMADVAVISTVDNMHYYPALQAIEKGYHLLLEKPVAQTAGECADIANAAREKGVSVTIYTYDKSKVLELDLATYNEQYPDSPMQVLPSYGMHDRFLFIDDTAYHFGASLKDLGKNTFFFTQEDFTLDEVLKESQKIQAEKES